MCHRGGEIDQDAEQYQAKSPLLKAELFKTKEMIEKETYNELSRRWKPTGRIFKIAGLRWIPTGKMFTSSTTKVDSKTSNGSNEDISNPHECEKTLDVSAEVYEKKRKCAFKLNSRATEDSSALEARFESVLVLISMYLLEGKLSKLQDEDAQNKSNIQVPRKLGWWKLKSC
ncbi:hypothetical protein Tco_1055604 [Tanacetum coccineum]|uniref:Uncharacterized protein n=1 Tax=Tanacetum coccineum TaxID=301880 RepID=A0ABQ5H245_9ASTR